MQTKLDKLKENRLLYHTILDTVKFHKKQYRYAKLDMHIHSNMSDGKFSIPEIVMTSRKIGLERIFITDHNTILPVFEKLQSLPKSLIGSLKIDVGCEIATRVEDLSTGDFFPIEILAYFADPYKVQEFLDKYDFSNNISQKEQLQELIDICDKIGLIHSYNIKLKKGEYATEALCWDLKKYKQNEMYFMTRDPKVWEEPKLFYKKFVANPKSDFYIDTTTDLPYYTDTIDAITKAGGISIVAHPFLYIYKSEDKVRKMLNHIVCHSSIHGIEAYHSAHTYRQRHFLSAYAKENNLLISGGSDFHCGPNTILGYGKKECPILLDETKIDWI